LYPVPEGTEPGQGDRGAEETHGKATAVEVAA
jgi:hypothetical protein